LGGDQAFCRSARVRIATGDKFMLQVSESLIGELELAVKSGSADARTNMLRQVTDLFLADAERLSDEQIKVFDDVLVLLIERIESQALVEVSKRLAPVDNAPVEAIRRLAQDDEIVVAGPVLSESKRLSPADLVEIAGTHSQAHLLAISGRRELEESVTDVLVNRGSREVAFRLAGNSGARFSQTGFNTMATRADGDDGLTERMALRLDVPARVLRQLLERATEAVRRRVLAFVPAEKHEEVRRVIADITSAVGGAVGDAAAERDFHDAELLVRDMQERGSLDETALFNFAKNRHYEEMTVALAVLCGASLKTIAELMAGVRNDALLIPCKAAGLTWRTVEAILRNRHANRPVSEGVIKLAGNDFDRLSVSTAQRTLRFMQIRQSVR
jgi:uncharacterized protein (DUF2336 family)